MENNILELSNKRKINLDKNLELDVSKNILDFKKILSNVVSSGTDYVIKSLDCDSEKKRSLTKVKSLFKGVDFQNLLKTSLHASIKLGLEIAKAKFPILKTIDGLKHISLKGGLGEMVASSIDIIASKFLKGNLIDGKLKEFFQDLRGFFKSNLFAQKIEQRINRLKNKVEKFQNLCKNWYEAYEKFDVTQINQVAQDLKKSFPNVSNDQNCVKENQVIQNMTKLINQKMDKLTKTQWEICANI